MKIQKEPTLQRHLRKLAAIERLVAQGFSREEAIETMNELYDFDRLINDTNFVEKLKQLEQMAEHTDDNIIFID